MNSLPPSLLLSALSREILMVASSNIKTPAMDVPLRPHPEARERGERLRKLFTRVTLAEVKSQVVNWLGLTLVVLVTAVEGCETVGICRLHTHMHGHTHTHTHGHTHTHTRMHALMLTQVLEKVEVWETLAREGKGHRSRVYRIKLSFLPQHYYSVSHIA